MTIKANTIKNQTISDRGILFYAYLNALGLAGRSAGAITAFSPSPAQTEYQKMDEDGNLTKFESDNFIDNLSLTLQFTDGCASPEVNEEIIIIPRSVHDREWYGVYKLTSKGVPSESQNGVRTVAVSARRAMNGLYKQTAVPVQPAMIYVESGTAGSGTYSYKLRNIGGATATDGDDFIIVNPDRLIAVAGFTFPASLDAVNMLFTPAADLTAESSVDVSLTPVAP